MNNPTIYLDSNIISSLHYRGSNELGAIRMRYSRDWWILERPYFAVWISKLTISELEGGKYSGQDFAIAEANRLPRLPFTGPVKSTMQYLLDGQIVPISKPADAIHLSFAIVHQIDYLLTWNYAHLANAHVQVKLAEMCKQKHWRQPLLVSPESIPKAAFGQSIWRTDA